ncbi:MAG: hypothetical protein F6J93_17625 [Oscillatoria sp. SIO1A7]|nr:hypothetical protein [Oscillatoria sp. SIO1A7]
MILSSCLAFRGSAIRGNEGAIARALIARSRLRRLLGKNARSPKCPNARSPKCPIARTNARARSPECPNARTNARARSPDRPRSY